MKKISVQVIHYFCMDDGGYPASGHTGDVIKMTEAGAARAIAEGWAEIPKPKPKLKKYKKNGSK